MRTAVVTCDACQEEVRAASARWCGHCGAALGSSTPVEAGSDAPVTAIPFEDEDPAPLDAPPVSPRSRLFGAALVIVVLGGLVGVQASREPPAEPHGYTSRGVPARTGVVARTALPQPTGVAWEAELTLPDLLGPQTTVRSSEHLVFVIDVDGANGVTAHDRATGEVRWSRRDLRLSGIDPLVAGDVLVVTVKGGRTVAIAPDGTTAWERDQGLTAPVAAGGGIADVSRGRYVVQRDAGTGEERWRIDVGGQLDASAQYVLDGGPEDLVVVLISRPQGLALGSNPEVETGHLLGIDAADGEIRWELDLPPALAWFRDPVAIDDRVAVAANVTTVQFWDLETGDSLASFPHGLGDRPFQVAAADGTALLLESSGVLIAVGPDARTRWAVPLTMPARIHVRDGLAISTSSSRTTVIDASTGRVLGGQPVAASSRRGPPGPHGAVFTLDGSGQLRVYEPTGGVQLVAPTRVPEVPAPAVADGAVFASTGTGVTAIDARDGERLWDYRSGDPATGIAADLYAPVVDEQVVIISPSRSQPVEAGGVFALQRDSGILAWSRLTDRPPPRGPLTFDRDIALLPVGRQIHGHAPANGRRALAAVGRGERGAVAAADGMLVAATAPGVYGGSQGPSLVAVRRADRSVRWEQHVDTCSAPSLEAGLAIVGTSAGINAFDLLTGEPRWSAETGGPVCDDLAVAEGVVVGVAMGRELYAIGLDDGGERWRTELPAAVAAAPAVTGDELVVPLLDGRLVSVALSDGSPGWTLQLDGIPASSPVVAGGRLLVILRDGRLLAER